MSGNYRTGAAELESTGNRISAATAGAVVRNVGEQIEEEFFGVKAQLEAAQGVADNPAELLIIEGDGSRYRTNEADQRRKNQQCASESASDGAPQQANPGVKADSEEKGQQPSKHVADVAAPEQRNPEKEPPPECGGGDRGWRENKVGVVVRARPGRYREDGSYQPPEELVKSYVATVDDIHVFGRELRTEAERRGLAQARDVVAVADNGHGLPDMYTREFPDLNRVTDFFHCSDRLSDCAEAHIGKGEAVRGAREEAHLRWRGLLWNGEVEVVITELREIAMAYAPQPNSLSELDRNPEAKTLWENVRYFEKYRDTMDYPAYRAKGWPMGSGSVESACGQFGDRVKHNRMRWTRPGAGAVHGLKANIESEDGRWEKRWPPPIPVLELSRRRRKVA